MTFLSKQLRAASISIAGGRKNKKKTDRKMDVDVPGLKVAANNR